MRLLNKTKNKILLEKVKVADNPWTRIKGLLFTKRLEKGHGLWLIPCNSVHMFGMTYPIDLIYLNKGNRVIKLIEGIRPFRLGPIIFHAKSVIELPCFTLKESDVALNDELVLEGI